MERPAGAALQPPFRRIVESLGYGGSSYPSEKGLRFVTYAYLVVALLDFAVAASHVVGPLRHNWAIVIAQSSSGSLFLAGAAAYWTQLSRVVAKGVRI